MVFTTNVLLLLSVCGCVCWAMQPNTVVDFCGEDKSVLSDTSEAFLKYDSTMDNTRYESCECEFCDTSPDELRSEQHYVFNSTKGILYKSSQSLNFSYPHGADYIKGSWKNNTVEGSFGTSLYLRCATFTLYLLSAEALVSIHADFLVNRSEVTVTCTAQGPYQIRDSEGHQSTNRPEIDMAAVGIGVGIAVIVVVVAVIGLCVYCKLGKSGSSPKFNRAEEALSRQTYNMSEEPKLHRDLDISAMRKRGSALLSQEENYGGNRQSSGSGNPGYSYITREVISPEHTLPEDGYDNSAFTVKEEVDEEPKYHTLEEGGLPDHSQPITREHVQSTISDNSNHYEEVQVREEEERGDDSVGNRVDSGSGDKEGPSSDHQELSAVSDEYASINKSPAHENPADEIPAEDYPVEDYPVEDYPAEDSPAEDYPEVRFSRNKNPANEDLTDENSADENSEDEIPGEKPPADESPVEEIPPLTSEL